MAKIRIKIGLFILLGYFFISKAMIWFHLKRLHGCCLRSAPARSGASQFAPWASAAVSHETRYHTNAISGQRRERSYTPVAGDSCCIALLTTGSFTWMLPAVGARSLRCFAIRSLGIRRCQPRHGDTIQNAISS